MKACSDMLPVACLAIAGSQPDDTEEVVEEMLDSAVPDMEMVYSLEVLVFCSLTLFEDITYLVEIVREAGDGKIE